MKVISVNAGQSRTVDWKHMTLTTSIFKQPVDGPVSVERLGLTNDTQSDLSVHGGPDKAVYAYPSEHYAFWKEELPEFDFQWGTFGENLTTTGLLESEVCLGNRYRIGSVELEVSQPRFPCQKLAMRFDDPLMVKRFLASRKSGIYFRVLQEGVLKTGDEIELLEATKSTTIQDFVTVYAEKSPDAKQVQSILNDPFLMEDWREFFENKLSRVA